MPNIPHLVQFNKSWSLQQLYTSMQRIWQQMSQIVNSRLSMGGPLNPIGNNIAGVWLAFVMAAPGTDLVLTHNLGYLPNGFIVMQKSAACDIFNGVGAWTKTTITLRGTVGGVTGWVFVL